MCMACLGKQTDKEPPEKNPGPCLLRYECHI